MRTSRVRPALQRQRMLRVHGLLCLALALLGGERLAAQGTTGAAVQGTVFEPDSVPVGSATVLITNSATGERWQTVTRDNGRFFLEHLSVGGPYRVDVRAIGFAPASRSGMFLSLSQRLTLDVGLVSAALQLEELTVRGTVDPRINAARTGPALSLSDSTIVRLPLPGNREWLVLMTQSPQVSFSPSGFSFAGAHDRLNSVQIDGTSNNDLKGRVGLTGVSELPPEAIQELQVVTAPFDVRYGNLAGGLVNAVTKSGTNRWEGSVFGYLANKGLSGTGPEGARLDAFSRKELALTLGGPIVHDKVAFFLSARGVRRIDPWPVNAPGSDTTAGADSAGVGIRYASLTRFQDILRSTYGVEPGTFNSNPKRDPFFDGFGKLTAQLGVNSRLEVSHEHRTGGFRQDGVQVPGFIALSSFGSYDPFHVDRTRVNWTVAIGTRWTNELLLGRSSTWHHCRPQSTFPQVEAQVDAGGVTAGAQDQCTGQANGQSIWEMTDNLDLAAGTHHLTFGTHNELVHVIDDDGVALEGGGQPHWFFTSLDSLEQGLPDGFVRNLPGPLLPASGRTELRVAQLGFYAQDQWTPTERLTLTGGLRVEIPYLPTAPTLNGELLGTLGINTSRTPGGHLLWSPRLGVNYDVGGRGATYLRGGIGLFEGRPPYVWLEEAYSGTGVQEVFLECFGGDVPAFTLDRAAQPTACGSGEQGTPVITAFDPDFRFPRNLKIVLGMDHRLPWDVVASVDLVHTRGVDQFRVRDANLLGPLGISSGEGGRALYGTIDPDFGFSEPRRVTDAVGPVVQITNDAGDRAYQVGVQLQKHFASGNEVILGYAYTRARDRQDNPGETSRATWAIGPDGPGRRHCWGLRSTAADTS